MYNLKEQLLKVQQTHLYISSKSCCSNKTTIWRYGSHGVFKLIGVNIPQYLSSVSMPKYDISSCKIRRKSERNSLIWKISIMICSMHHKFLTDYTNCIFLLAWKYHFCMTCVAACMGRTPEIHAKLPINKKNPKTNVVLKKWKDNMPSTGWNVVGMSKTFNDNISKVCK